MIKTVIFDLGGVLVRTENRQPRQKLAEQLGITYEELSNFVYGIESANQATRGEITADEHKSIVLQKLNLPPDSFSTFGDEFWGGDSLDAHLVEFIKGLREEYSTALLSNAWDDLRGYLEKVWQIDGIFDHIFISAELKLAKPAPEIYQFVINRLNQDPTEMVFVDDFIENIEAAREAGLNAVHFQSREQALDDLAEYLDTDL
ncbi:MAG: HAD family phosphatase [Anaerolineales bacterium]